MSFEVTFRDLFELTPTYSPSPELAGYMAKYIDVNIINAVYDAASKIGNDLVVIFDPGTHNLIIADRNALRENDQVPEATRNSLTKSAQEAVGMEGISLAGQLSFWFLVVAEDGRTTGMAVTSIRNKHNQYGAN